MTPAQRPSAACHRSSGRPPTDARDLAPMTPAPAPASPAAHLRSTNHTPHSLNHTARAGSRPSGDQAPPGAQAADARHYDPMTPARRPRMPEEQAAAIVFLASDAASNINGVILPVDDGWSAV
ncbi:SDR family oxidoreductase [Streptomyces sp. Marseille-Q5077]|uniref:SDR family oxidoreductase n=1 Tax=Streptomyces sp. Marseille-Q5077 TaxID=3418995 RepID=UPI003D005C94